MAGFGRVGPVEELEVVAVDLPEGYWELESSQNPEPISPMAESFFLEALTAAARHMFAELGILLETAEWRTFGGWVYLRAVPYEGDAAERLGRCVEAFRDDVAGRYVQRWYDEWRPWLQRRAAELGGADLAALDAQGLDDHVQEVIAYVFAATDVHILLHGANAVMLGELVFGCGELLGWDEVQALELLCGASPASTEPARRLAEVARIPEREPAFAAAFDAYVREFGGRAIRYEVADPTVGELPDLLLGLVRDQAAVAYDHDAVAARVTSRQAAARAAARAVLAERNPDARARFEQLLERAERFYPVREDNEVWTTNVPLGLARRALLELGRRLAASGAVARADDVFLLRLEEARPALHKDLDLTVLVTERQQARSQAAAQPPPASYGTAPPPPDFSALPDPVRRVHEAVGWLIDRILAPSAAGRRQAGPAVSGVGASRGRHTGPARVILREADLHRLRPGEVLVCPVTSPAWSMVFPSVAALVTDLGGILSHPAIIAREFGIPAVVATGNATAIFTDGEIVTVDGDRGTVVAS